MTEITPAVGEALHWLRALAETSPNSEVKARSAAILTLLPAELTNPQPELPTEPGLYVSASYGNEYAWRFDEEDTWWLEGRWVDSKMVANNAPFTRLVPERSTITREQIESACTSARADRPNPLQIHAILALVNGKGAES